MKIPDKATGTQKAFSYPVLPHDKDLSIDYQDIFIGWMRELKSNVTLFGCSRIVARLIELFPDAITAIVDLDPEKQKHKIQNVPIISFEEYLTRPQSSIVITDIHRQYMYLRLIYDEILVPRDLITFEGIEKILVRYNYELKNYAYGNDPAVFDYEYLHAKRSLPMECTIPVGDVIRLMDFVRASVSLDGIILELGTGLGGSTYYMASALENLGVAKQIISIDRFENEYYIPDLNYETAVKHLARFPFVQLVKGTAPDKLLEMNIHSVAFAFIDMYAFPAILEYVYPRVVSGGSILIDNYNHGCYHNHGKMIADVFFYDKPEKIIRVGGAQGLVVKRSGC
jgi:predicted O-methyltransferase YrrM